MIKEAVKETITEMMRRDYIYLQDLADLAELERRYQKLNLTRQQRIIINDYIACLNKISFVIEK